MKLESWSKKDAALIICGYDPLDYRSTKFTEKGIPKELLKPYKIYRIFRSANFRIKYNDIEGYPLHYLEECDEKDIPVVEGLRKAAKKRIAYLEERKKRLNTKSEAATDNKLVMIDSREGARERRYLLKIIGVMANLYFQ